MAIRHHIRQQVHVKSGRHRAGRQRSRGAYLRGVRRLYAGEITRLPSDLHGYRLQIERRDGGRRDCRDSALLRERLNN